MLVRDLILYGPKWVAIVYSLTSDFDSEQREKKKTASCSFSLRPLLHRSNLRLFQCFVSFSCVAETADLRAGAAALVMETDTWRWTCRAPYPGSSSFYSLTQSVSQSFHCCSQSTAQPVDQSVSQSLCQSTLSASHTKQNTNQDRLQLLCQSKTWFLLFCIRMKMKYYWPINNYIKA